MKNNPFLYAGAEGYLDILKLTIDAGADPRLQIVTAEQLLSQLQNMAILTL